MTNPKVFFTNKELRDAEAGIKPLPRVEDMTKSERLQREVLAGVRRASKGYLELAADGGHRVGPVPQPLAQQAEARLIAMLRHQRPDLRLGHGEFCIRKGIERGFQHPLTRLTSRK